MCISVAASAEGGGSEQGTGRYGRWGVELTNRDTKVRPGDDFFLHSSGGYFARTPIAADKAWQGSWDELFTRTEAQLSSVIQSIDPTAPPGSERRKIADFYRSYLDVNAIDARGLAPAAGILDQIGKVRSHSELAGLMVRPDLLLRSPVSIGIAVDRKNPDRHVISIGASPRGLGLPGRDYYLKPDGRFADVRGKYRAHIIRMLSLAGLPDGDAKADAILALETRIASAHWPREKLRNRDLTYNPLSLGDLKTRAGAFPWDAALQAKGLGGRDQFVAGALEPLDEVAHIFAQTPLDVWRAWLAFHLLDDNADLLPSEFDQAGFAFRGRVLNGQSSQEERWKRAIAATDDALGHAVGRLYAERYFPASSKTKMEALVVNLRAAAAARLSKLAWMSPDTRSEALAKLSAMRAKIGFPSKWRDNEALDIRLGDAFGNALRAAAFEWRRDLERLDRPTDREEWSTTPQTVNAFYDPSFNEIVFPAAILQPPFFDPSADPAVNYGGIGVTIGHEIGHAFDDQGAKADARGVERNWWTVEDAARFRSYGDRLATQFDGYSVLDDVKVRGRLVLGENIADLFGLAVAKDAYARSLGGRQAPRIDGLTGAQRFYLGYAQVWRIRFREQKLRSFVMSDPHSPPEWRVNGVLRNVDDWYRSWGVGKDNALYLATEDRIDMW